MAKVTFLLGLCGSGKTWLSKKLREQTGAMEFEGLINDAEKRSALIEWLKNGNDGIVEEIWYCIPSLREPMEQTLLQQVPGLEIQWICFEKDLKAANRNLEGRTDKGDVEGHKGINQKIHDFYSCPDGATIVPVWRA